MASDGCDSLLAHAGGDLACFGRPGERGPYLQTSRPWRKDQQIMSTEFELAVIDNGSSQGVGEELGVEFVVHAAPRKE